MLKLIADINRKIDTFGTVSDSTQPLIGITANNNDGLSYIKDRFSHSVIKAGGIPFIIPVTKDINILTAIVEKLDGLLIPGGGEITPEALKELYPPDCNSVKTIQEEFELMMLRLAFNRQIPVLGIHRGHHLINITFSDDMKQYIAARYIENNSDLSLRMEHGKTSDIIKYANYPIMSVKWHPDSISTDYSKNIMMKLHRWLIGEATLYAKVKTIHRKIITLDSHTDTPLFFLNGYKLSRRNIIKVNPSLLDLKGHVLIDYEVKVDITKMREGMCDAVYMVAYQPQGELTDEASDKAIQTALSIIKKIRQKVKNNISIVEQAVTVDDVIRIKQQGKKAILIGVENGYAIGKKIKTLTTFADLGVVYMTLSHNGDNDICDSAINSKKTHKGLSNFGKEVVREMNRLGIMIDISHTSERTMLDVLLISSKPIIASHSALKAVNNHPRNISDRVIRLLKNRGGVVQICLYDEFLNARKKANVDDIIKHINYMVRAFGINHVGIGTDFDGCDRSAGLRGINEMPRITTELLRAGYTTQEIGKIWGGNFLRVMKDVQSVRT
ncbi:MAG: membrane dipeptidase [Tannerella sp.]|jgi:microsomal dipeptidase-like Zn-dependent dipeptidase/gamma-glutamyl-gamma-aminobutyrate hydrolase PuuD|nr:membrane dipeptidase [Tannerella sp.]